MSFNANYQMNLELVAENIPFDADRDRGLTIAQIHNRYCDTDRPMLRLEIVGGQIRMIMAQARDGSDNYDRLEGTGMSYSEGDRLVVTLRMRRVNWIYYYIHNKKTGQVEEGEFRPPSDWRSSDLKEAFYFKTGAYQQAESDGENPRVSFTKLQIEVSTLFDRPDC